MRRDELVKWYREMSTYKKKVAYLKVFLIYINQLHDTQFDFNDDKNVN